MTTKIATAAAFAMVLGVLFFAGGDKETVMAEAAASASPGMGPDEVR